MKVQRFVCILSALLLAPILASAAPAEKEIVVLQKDKAFSATKLKIKVGDSIKFVNDDPYSHNVFSLSDAKSFDLGTYPKGVAKSVTFDKPGTVEIECAVHPAMKLVVEVEK